jgi:hypothetical protein
MPAWLERLPGRVLAYQTVFVEYLPPEVRAAYEAGMRRWSARPGVAWVELETGEGGAPAPARIRVHRAGETAELGACEYHPTVVHMHPY